MALPHASKSSSNGLRLSSWSERAQSLEAQRKALEQRIERKRNELERFHGACHDLASKMAARLQPIMDRGTALDSEVHELFAEIFQTRKLGKQSRKKIERIYQYLQTEGLISPRTIGGDMDGAPLPGGRPPGAGPGPAEAHAGADEPHWHMPAWEAAPQERSRDLRDTFLHLAGKFHPDKAEDADTQHRHTEIMKELNRAYRDGDAAALFALERKLAAQELGSASDGSDPEARCARLETMIGLLQEQLHALGEELAQLRDSEIGELVREHRRLKRLSGGDLLDPVIDEFIETIEMMEEIRDFVRKFRNREMTIAEFVRGPASMTTENVDEDLDALLEELIQAAALVHHGQRAAPPRRARGGKASGAQAQRGKRKSTSQKKKSTR